MDKSKFTYPKCPFCKKEYKEDMGEYNLMRLAKDGWRTSVMVRCKHCNERFNVRIHISYYGSKIK